MITIEEVRNIKNEITKEGLTTVSCFTFNAIAELAISQHEEIERLRAANKDLQAWFDDLKAEFDKVRPVVDAAKEFSGEHHLWSTTKPTAYMVEDESRLLRAKTNLVLLARALKTGEPK